MSAKAFFDTNILIYAIAEDRHRTPAAEALLRAGGIISVQVLNELVSVARKKLRMSWTDVTTAVGAIVDLCPDPVAITLEIHETARRLAARHGYHIYDALIVAAALTADCVTLYTEDLRAGEVIDGRVTIQNPFHP